MLGSRVALNTEYWPLPHVDHRRLAYLAANAYVGDEEALLIEQISPGRRRKPKDVSGLLQRRPCYRMVIWSA